METQRRPGHRPGARPGRAPGRTRSAGISPGRRRPVRRWKRSSTGAPPPARAAALPPDGCSAISWWPEGRTTCANSINSRKRRKKGRELGRISLPLKNGGPSLSERPCPLHPGEWRLQYPLRRNGNRHSLRPPHQNHTRPLRQRPARHGAAAGLSASAISLRGHAPPRAVTEGGPCVCVCGRAGTGPASGDGRTHLRAQGDLPLYDRECDTTAAARPSQRVDRDIKRRLQPKTQQPSETLVHRRGLLFDRIRE